MEKKPDQKKKNQSTLVFVLLLMIILVIFVTNDGMETPSGIAIAGVIFFLMLIGLVKITKNEKKPKTSTTNPPALTVDTQPKIPENPNDFPPVVETPISSVPTPNSGTPSQPNLWNKINTWLQQFPPKKQLIIVGGGLVTITIFIIIFFGFVTGRFWAPSPVGAWTIEGYEDRIVINIYEDGTYTYIDNGEQTQSGTWSQTGNQVDCVMLIYSWMDDYPGDVGETTRYIISRDGDTMTSGANVYPRISSN